MQTLKVNKVSDLPQWNIALNHKGMPLYNGVSGKGYGWSAIALVKDPSNLPVNDLRSGQAQLGVWIVLTEEFRRENGTAFAGVISRIQDYKGLVIEGYIYTSQDIIDSIHEGFEQGKTTLDDAQSEAHRLFDRIGMDALERGASDIHITLFPNRTEIKMRIKGELRHYMDLSRDRGLALVSSAYNTLSETGSTKEGFNERAYQDAVIERVYPQGLVRFRYSGMPIAPDGADITLRLIPIGIKSRRKTLAELGYSPDQVRLLQRIFSRSSGMILIAGTTGSGKSTTIATVLEELAEKHPGKKIRTVEQPVEYKIHGAYQTPVLDVETGDKTKTPFLIALRQIMRADPDIIAVGEIRDFETANVAIQAVRSGHLLVSTIHADGSPVCYDRLAGMGVNRLDLATINLVAGLIYQKLVPVLCEHCKLSYTEYVQGESVDHELLERLHRVTDGEVESIYFRHPQGCPHCNGDGVKGREVVAEILRPVPNMAHAVAEGDSAALWRMWRSTIRHDHPNDMTGRTAFEHALWKMRQGRVDPRDVEEAFRYIDEPPFEEV